MQKLIISTIAAMLVFFIKIAVANSDNFISADKNNILKFDLKKNTGNFDQEHQIWDQFLKKFVLSTGKGSQVKYLEIKKDPALLQAYLAELNSVSKNDYDSWNKAQKLSFLINAYNAYTVALIVNNYPLKSIKDLGDLFSSASKIKFFKLFNLDSSLDDLEQNILRKDFNEPRIHFALVCASKSCPPLRNEAFQADQLESQLEASAINFLEDNSKNFILESEQTLNISSIFKWYGKDFNQKYGSVENFVTKRISNNLAVAKYKIIYLPYDWSLNEAK